MRDTPHPKEVVQKYGYSVYMSIHYDKKYRDYIWQPALYLNLIISFCIQGNKGLLNVIMSVLSCTFGLQKWKPLLSSLSQMSTLSRAFQTSAIKCPKYTQTSSKRRALSFESFRGDIRPCRFFSPESFAAHKLNYSLHHGERSEAWSNCPNFKCNDMSKKIHAQMFWDLLFPVSWFTNSVVG